LRHFGRPDRHLWAGDHSWTIDCVCKRSNHSGECSHPPPLVLAWLRIFSNSTVFHLAWAFLFSELFQILSRPVARFAAFVILVGCAVQALTCVLYIAPLAVLSNPKPLSAFTGEQLQALALALFKINGQAFDAYLIFFGLWCILNGYLIFRSTFMPRVLGILVVISGIGWMTFICPPFAHSVFPYIAVASAIGELPLQLWLLIMGVNSERWNAQAHAAGLTEAI
jgi:hypothetical protein